MIMEIQGKKDDRKRGEEYGYLEKACKHRKREHGDFCQVGSSRPAHKQPLHIAIFKASL